MTHSCFPRGRFWLRDYQPQYLNFPLPFSFPNSRNRIVLKFWIYIFSNLFKCNASSKTYSLVKTDTIISFVF